MKLVRILILLIIAASLGVTATAATKSESAPNATNPPPVKEVKAEYFYSAELAYVSIKISNSHLIADYLPTTWKCKETGLITQAPQYKTSDLKHADVKLTPERIAQLVRLVRRNGFLKLDSVYDDSKGRRCYPVRIAVQLDDTKKDVEHRAGPVPKAFVQVRDWLRKTAAGKIKDFPPAE